MLQKIIFLFISIWSAAWAGPVVEINNQQELNDYIAKSGFNGTVLVAKDKNVLFKKAYGYKNLETKIPLSVDDKFQIGSNTKQLVAASLLKLQEEGLLSIEDPITKYLPELVQYKGITIRDILNHTSGINNFTDRPEFLVMMEANRYFSLDDIINFSLSYPLDFEVKSQWKYSNTGYIIAGKIIEVVSKKTWDGFIAENFLRPLQMDHTGYEKDFEKISDVVGHTLENGVLTPSLGLNLTWALSAGALYSNVDDLLKWTAIYDESMLINDASKKDMQTPFLSGYGLGLMIGPSKYKEEMLQHNGHTVGFGSNLVYFKQSKLTVITLDNVDGEKEGISNVLIDLFQTGHTVAVKLDYYEMPKETLQDFVGVYASKDFEIEVYLDQGIPYLKTKGQRPYLLKANDKDSFNLEGFAGEEFMRNDLGSVIGLKHYQNGAILYLTKKS
jgi:CubicO group peptidase (beta-lactamase class C family)